MSEQQVAPSETPIVITIAVEGEVIKASDTPSEHTTEGEAE